MLILLRLVSHFALLGFWKWDAADRWSMHAIWICGVVGMLGIKEIFKVF